MGKRAIPGVAIPCLLAVLFSLPTAMPIQPPAASPGPSPLQIQQPAALREKVQTPPAQAHFLRPPINLVTPVGASTMQYIPLPPTAPTVGIAPAEPVTIVDADAIPLASPDDFIAAMAPSAQTSVLPTSVALSPFPSCPASPLADCQPVPPVGPRDKGWIARAFCHYQTGREGYFFKPTEYSAFDLKGAEYGVGMRRDMSIDTIAGLSFRALDYQITGAGYADARKNDIAGWLAEVDFSKRFSLPIFGNKPFMLEGSIGYGVLTTEGKGEYLGLAWREKKHDSSLYRASAKIRTSQRTRYSFYLESEFGVELTRIASDAYTADWGQAPATFTFDIAKKTSTTVSAPIRFTLWEEYPFRWGTGIFRLMLGARYDFGNGGTAAYSYNASAGGMARPNLAAGKVDIQYDPRGAEFEAGIGVDLWANRGWYCRADYKARFSGSMSQINESLFSLELGACF